MSTMAARLVGTWDLVSFVSYEADGSAIEPFGRAVGRIMYDAAGHMAGQVMRPGRAAIGRGEASAEQIRAAYTGYIAYFGRYTVNDSGDVVTHHVAGSLNPGMVGGDQIRRMTFDGDRLVLEAAVQRRGETIRQVLTWRKLV
jgi:hypothetical protein